MKPVYLDHHATTPLDPRVLDEMLPFLTEKFGNASSLDHPYGYEASVAVESAREKIAKAIGSRHDEIVFTSGATESDNIALSGTMKRYEDRGDHLITCMTEHKAVLDTARHLGRMGKSVTYLQVNEYGEIDLAELEDAITDKTVMISVMACKQRDRDNSRAVQDRTHCAQERCHIPYGCSAGCRTHTGGRRGNGHRPDVVFVAQSLRAQGSRGAVRTWGGAESETGTNHARWGPGKKHTIWHPQRPGDCGVWEGNRSCGTGDGFGKQAVRVMDLQNA